MMQEPGRRLPLRNGHAQGLGGEWFLSIGREIRIVR
jgi:hypothetical protein